MNKYTLLTYVENRPGVLNKVANLIRRKMYNIDTLTVSDTGDKRISGMTITITTDKIGKVKQMMRQIEKLPEVIYIKNLDPEKSFWREVALVKCDLKQSKLKLLRRNCNIEVLYEDDKSNRTILQIAGTSRDIEACMSEVGIDNIKDVTRTGLTAMEIEGISPDYLFKLSQEEREKVTNF